MVISTTSTAPVAIALASRASAMLPSASRSAMMPEPTTVLNKRSVPRNSAARGRIVCGRAAISEPVAVHIDQRLAIFLVEGAKLGCGKNVQHRLGWAAQFGAQR